MKKLICLSVFALIIVAGCRFEREDRLEYSPVATEQIPDKYPDNSFSVRGFLAVKDQYENQSVNIRGIVKYKYACPPCPKGVLCKMCANDYILLADPVKNITESNEIVINFFKGKEIYQTLELGEEITLNVRYNSENQGGAGSKNGYFVYSSLKNT